MNTIFIEAKMGIAGDMLMAALYEICPKQEEFLSVMNTLLPGQVTVKPVKAAKCGITGTHMEILIQGQEELQTLSHSHTHCDDHADHTADHNHHNHHHGHHHHSYIELVDKIKDLKLPPQVKENAVEVYKALGQAEAKVHNSSLEQIHFHEVGSLDALIDIVGCCLLFHYLNANLIICSPIHVGNGTVHCAHGVLPVPAPATAELLKGLPYYTGDIPSELCTPTGAALIKHFAKDYSNMPSMKTQSIGYGLGTKDFDVANVLRVFYGESTSDIEGDMICDISCNLDDMTGEALGYAMEVLMDEGALDVYFTPIQMKKNRPGTLLHCFCSKEDTEKFIELVLMHTTTRGLRYQFFHRRKLISHMEEIDTNYGKIHIKKSQGDGIQKQKPEYEDIKKLAKENHLPISHIYQDL